MRAIRSILIAAAATLLTIAAGGAALADPNQPPTLTTNVGVGATVTTQVFAGSPTENTAGSLMTDYNATDPAYLAASWDAMAPSAGTGDIITKESGPGDTSCELTRPDDSSAGIVALNANQKDSAKVNGQAVYCIDFARSYRPPNTTSFKDAFAALAEDATAWSYPVVSGQVNPQPASLTLAQLQDIYTCTDTNWDQVGGANAPIVPVLPTTTSDTRQEFLTILGIIASSEPCWVNGVAGNGDMIEENTGLTAGNEYQFDQGSSVDDIFPYSIGDWIAQGPAVTGTGAAGTPGGATVGGHASSTWGHGDLTLGETDSNGLAQKPVIKNKYGQPVINPSFPSQFSVTLYNAVRNGCPGTSPLQACWPSTPTYESVGLQGLFGPSGWACTSDTAQSDIVSYGFSLQPASCGDLVAGD